MSSAIHPGPDQPHPAILPDAARREPMLPDTGDERATSGKQTRAPTAADIAVGLRIRALRRAAGCTQKQLAHHLGVTNAQLHRYETGVSRVAASRLVCPSLRSPIPDSGYGIVMDPGRILL
jgi:DNA-binding XRE family transcriptional regulator